jgi:hypothetical protein
LVRVVRVDRDFFLKKFAQNKKQEVGGLLTKDAQSF